MLQFQAFGPAGGNGQDHLFHGHTAMLEGAVVLALVLMVGVGIHEIVVVLGKDDVVHNALGGQAIFGWFLGKEGVPVVGSEVFPLFVAHRDGGIAIAHHLGGAVHLDGTVICGDDANSILLGDQAQRFIKG